MNPLSVLNRTPGKPLVSILIPTRTRPESRLEEVIEKSIGNSKVPEGLEFCIKVDSDDLAALNMSERLAAKYKDCSSFKITVLDRGQGYLDMPRYINELASIASGDWLWMLSDNAWPVTQNWDYFLENWFPPSATYIGCQDVCLFSPIATMENGFRIPISPCPFIRRKMFEVLGHITLLPSWDMWLNSVAWLTGTLMTVPIQLEHIPPVSRTDFDEEMINRMNGKRHSVEMRRKVIEDATKLIDYLADLEAKAKWLPSPERPGLHYWKSPLGFLLLTRINESGQIEVSDLASTKMFVPGGLWCAVSDNGDLL